jgi:uncharacterized protein YjbI with pentapeptide repeats
MQIADDQQQETTLKSYLDDMSDLLLNHGLRTAKSGDEVSQVARERTLTTLRRLKADRNKIVVQFLQDAHLIGTPNAVINFSNADLSGDDLRGARLGGVNLSGADLTNASLNDANLTQADLRDADLSNANLFHADLYDTNLSRAILRNATLTIAFLRDANLTNADLGSANLNGAYLGGANLNGAFLSNSDLSGISGLTQQQLDKVFFCKGATLPQGLVCHRTP